MKRRSDSDSKLNLFLFLLPTLLFVVVFIAFPVVFSGYLSLTRFNYANDVSPHFIGFLGYARMIAKDSFFHSALVNQAQFAVAYFVLTFLISLLIAIVINELRRGIQIFQIFFYMPMIIPLSLVGITFQWILAPNFGFFNLVLKGIGLGHLATDWFGQPNTAIYGIVVARSWAMIGFTLIIFLAGLQGLSKSLREAARVDGANFYQEVFYVTLPNLKPYLLVGSIWILINSLKVFALPAVITEGGPGDATLTLYLYSWKLAFQRFDMGQAAQVAYITAAIILILAFGLDRLFRSDEE